MRGKYLFVYIALVTAAAVAVLDRQDSGAKKAAYASIPLFFEENVGQTAAEVRYISRGAGYSLYLTDTEAVLRLNEGAASGDTVTMSLVGAVPRRPVGEGVGGGRSNYLIGKDRAKWRTDVRQFEKVRYREVYPGVDQVFYGRQRELEYDLVVAAGADTRPLRLRFDGAESIDVDAATGELVLALGDGREVRQMPPFAYQDRADGRVQVAAAYVIDDGGTVGFDIAAYDEGLPLVIDPVLTYSTYLGGAGSDQMSGIAIDANGNAYVSGYTASLNFPTVSPVQAYGGATDAFVTKINPSGTAIVYSTYFGGSGLDRAWAIAVGPDGSAYFAGETASADLPTVTAVQGTYGGMSDAFLAKLAPTGTSLAYSTYLGGSAADYGWDVAVDSAGNAYVTGESSSANFPLASAFQSTLRGGQDAFVTKMNAAGTALVYSTFLGGTNFETGYTIAVDAAGNAYPAGITHSTNFPTVSPIQPANTGQYSGFVTKLNAAGTALVYSTYLGGDGGNIVNAIAVEPNGTAYLTGLTTSTAFPVVNALQSTYGGGDSDAFVTKINAAGTGYVYSTYLGGSLRDTGFAIDFDSAGAAYVGGYAYSADFPVLNAVQANLVGAPDATVTVLGANGASLLYSTYLGGTGFEGTAAIAVDAAGNAYISGNTASSNFPRVNPLQSTYGGSPFDGYAAKIANTAGTPTPTNTPTATPTNTPTATPTATPAGGGSEGDVAPRNSGDGAVLSTDVTQMRRFAAGLDTPNAGFNEFQRADCAPRATLGDAVINAGDVVQARRYATGLDPLTPAGGPAAREGEAAGALWRYAFTLGAASYY